MAVSSPVLPKPWLNQYIIITLAVLSQSGSAQSSTESATTSASLSTASPSGSIATSARNTVAPPNSSSLSTSPSTTITGTGTASYSTPASYCTSTFDYDCNPSKQNDDNGTAFGYYYVFIAIFFVLVAAAVWFVHQRRRKRLMQNVNSRRTALARDMQNDQLGQLYPNSRRWTGEGRRGHGRRVSGHVMTRRDDGLDELGEAPPPYKPAGEALPPNHAPLAIPMQALRRDGSTSKPPEYEEYFAPPPGNPPEARGSAGPSNA